MFALHCIASKYFCRGHKTTYDLEIGDFIKDGNSHLLYLSGIVGVRQVLVKMRLEVLATDAHKKIEFACRGNIDGNNKEVIFTQSITVKTVLTLWIPTNESGQIQYRIEAATWTLFNAVICGYLVF